MPVPIDEDHCAAADELVYPNVQSCIALAVGTTGGSLVGMHLTIGTSAAQVKSAALALTPSMVGNAATVVCIGNTEAFAGAGAQLTFPGLLRQALKDGFQFAGNIDYFNAGPLFRATSGGGPAGGSGVVVRAWRDAQSHALRHAVGPYTAAAKHGTAAVLTPLFKISTVRTTNLTGKQQPVYVLGAGMGDVPALGLATM